MPKISKLNLTTGQVARFDPAKSWEIEAVESINGATLESSGGSGSPASVSFPAGVVVLNCTFTGIDNSGGTEVDATDPSNTNGGGNTNIDFGVRAPFYYEKLMAGGGL